MKTLLSIIAVLLCTHCFSQTAPLYVPNKPDSLKLAAQVNGVVRSIYNVDLQKNLKARIDSVPIKIHDTLANYPILNYPSEEFDPSLYSLKSDNLSGLASVTTARTNLGLGTLATQSGTFSGTSSGTNTGDETTTRINALYGYTPANVGSISLATPNVIFSTPVNFTNTSGAWAGTLALNSQTTNKIFASPNGSTGTPSFRALVGADIPDLSATYAALAGSYANPSWITSLAQSKITYAGTSLQYVKGDGSVGTFPTGNSAFTNDAGYATSAKVFMPYQAEGAVLTPTANTTYYFGSFGITLSPTTTVLNRQIVMPYACTLVGYSITTRANQVSSAETSAISIRINNTTDVLLSNVGFNATGGTLNFYSATNLSTAFAAGDKWEIKWVTPATWATIPANEIVSVILYFQPL